MLGALIIFVALAGWCLLEAIRQVDLLQAFTAFFAWCLYFILVGISTVVVSHRATQGFLHITVPLDRTLTEHGRREYATWASSALSVPLQTVSGLALGLAAPCALWIVQRIPGNGTVMILPPSYVVVGAVGFMVGCTAYWVVAGTILCRVLARPRRMTLYPMSPARTPGIEELSQIMVTAFAISGLYSVALLFPFLYWTRGFTTETLPADLVSTLNYVKVALIGLCGLATLGVGIVPQYYLSSSIRARRRTTMLSLEKRMRLDKNVWQGRTKSELAEHYDRISNSPASTLGSANVVQIAVGVAAAVIPFAISILGVATSS